MGHTTLAICNAVASSIAREADGGVYLHAGPEIGVASTKAFTSQVCVLTMLALYLGRTRHLSSTQGQKIIDDLHALPEMVRKALECHDRVKEVAAKYADAKNVLYLGRQYLYPVALEGRAEVEGDQLHSRGGLPGRGDEARPDRGSLTRTRRACSWCRAATCSTR